LCADKLFSVPLVLASSPYRTMVTVFTTCFDIKNSTFCSRLLLVFICLRWISEKHPFLSLTVITNSSLWYRGTVFTVSRCWPCVRHGGTWHIDPLSLNLGIGCWQGLVSSLGFFTTRNIVPGTDWIRGYVDNKADVNILGKRKISRIFGESNTIQWSPESILVTVPTDVRVCFYWG